jgi:hypothetical protein
MTIFESYNNTTSAAISYSPYASAQSHLSTKSHQNYYYNEYHEGIIEIANSLLKMFLSQVMDNTMVAAVKENEYARKNLLLW